MRNLYKILFIITIGLFTAGIVSASLGEYWSTISHLIPRTNDAVDVGSTAARVRAFFTNDLTFYDEIKPDNATCANGEILKKTGANNWDCATDATGAGGSAIIFDIGDDGGNDSVDVTEIATTGDTNNIFTEPANDKILIAVGNNWPTADLASTLTVVDESTATTTYIGYFTAATGSLAAKTGSNLTFNSATGMLTATGFTGNVTGDCSGSSGSCTGNAATATALAGNGNNCAAGSAPLGVDASGAVESCFDVWTEAENTAASYWSTLTDMVLTDNYIYVGDASNDPVGVAMSNDCSIASNGAITCDHDALDNFLANEHLDWTGDLGAVNIHAGNYTTLTNLTDFDQTAWRLFYSNNLGDVIELSLGTDGQYLKSQGGTSSLTWGVPTDTNTNANTICAGGTTYLDGEGNCDDISSVYQPLDAQLTDLADGTLTGNFINTANPWADNEVANDITIDLSTLASTITVADESADTSCFVGYFTGASGSLAAKTGTNLTFNSSSGVLTATGFAGPLVGNVTGDCSGSSGSCTGEAATVATINGLAPNTATTQAAQGNITSLGTLTGLTMSGDIAMGGNNIDNGGVIFLTEQADADADVAGKGQIWVNTATPNELWFTDDAGTDTQLGAAGATPTDITVADESVDTTCFVGYFTAATGDLGPKTGTNITFNSATGILTASGFTGNVTGNCSGSSGTCSGLAATATALAGNGANCAAGSYPLGVDASGAVESCTDATTEINSVVNGLGGTGLTCSAQSCDVDLGTSIDMSDETNFTAGRSLTESGDSVLADSELYTDTKCVYWEDNLATDDFKSIWYAEKAVTITRLWCESDQTVNMTIQEDDGSPADIETTDLVCDSTPADQTSGFEDAAIAAGSRLDFAVTSVSGTPTWCSICWSFTYDD